VVENLAVTAWLKTMMDLHFSALRLGLIENEVPSPRLKHNLDFLGAVPVERHTVERLRT